jgi:cell division protein FtsL
MTPSATATPRHEARPTRRRPAGRPPRRVSGPARPAARGTRAPAGGAVAVTPPLGLRLARAGGRIVDARFLDRLLRGRAWIALLALGLMGIVFIQVSMLRLNAGISRAITSADTLHRQNSTLRADISKLDSSERIGDAAKSFGMIQPAAGSVTYLDARKANGAAAARGIHRPKAPKTATAATTTAPAVAATTTTATATAPPATTTQAVTTPPPATTQTQTQTQAQTQAATTPPPATTAPATTTAAPTQQAAPVQPTQTQTQAVAPAPATTATGQGGQ